MPETISIIHSVCNLGTQELANYIVHPPLLGRALAGNINPKYQPTRARHRNITYYMYLPFRYLPGTSATATNSLPPIIPEHGIRRFIASASVNV